MLSLSLSLSLSLTHTHTHTLTHTGAVATFNQERKYAPGPQRVHDNGAGQEEASPRRVTRRHWMQSNVCAFSLANCKNQSVTGIRLGQDDACLAFEQ